jgi:hypothetical protein
MNFNKILTLINALCRNYLKSHICFTCFRPSKTFHHRTQGDVTMINRRKISTSTTTTTRTAFMVLIVSTTLTSTLLIDKVESLGMLLTQSQYEDTETGDAVFSYNRYAGVFKTQNCSTILILVNKIILMYLNYFLSFYLVIGRTMDHHHQIGCGVYFQWPVI